jgi:hypothetical protein
MPDVIDVQDLTDEQVAARKRLRDLIWHVVNIFQKANWPPISFEFPTLILLNLWNKENQAYNDRDSQTYRQMLFEKGFNEHNIIKPFKDIIAHDDHLYKCCNDIYRLSVLIDKYFIPLYKNKPELYDSVVSEFIELVYDSGSFMKISFSHIYNFDSDIDRIPFPQFKIVKIEDQLIPYITGEPTYFPSFLHPPGVGNYFITFQENHYIDDKDVGNWLQEAHKRGSEVINVLQYINDGIVHIDYTGLYFLPQWVNVLRRPGIYMVGRPRITFFQGGKNYFLDSQGRQTFEDMFVLYDRYKSRIFDDKCDLRNSIRHAANYYELSLATERLEDRFIDLWISMEALFSPSKGDQLSHSIPENAAFFLGEKPQEREDIFNKLRSLYGKRSKLVHGVIKNVLNLDEVEGLSSLVRTSILKFTTLQLRGYKSVDKVHKTIRSGIFDPDALQKLRSESSIEKFILENES